ncbi:MAG: hypothetical protein ABIP53_03735, partial [Candidatus Limnocylindrales bacterium]
TVSCSSDIQVPPQGLVTAKLTVIGYGVLPPVGPKGKVIALSDERGSTTKFRGIRSRISIVNPHYELKGPFTRRRQEEAIDLDAPMQGDAVDGRW